MYEDEGYQLMGAAFEVYNHFGYGMAEEVYQQCLEIELTAREIPFSSKHTLNLAYKGKPVSKRYVPDLFVHNAIIVELKAVKALGDEHQAQLFNYLRIAHQPVGYLLNFGNSRELKWQRFILNDLHRRSS